LFNHRQKITGARTPSRTPSNGLETANQKETFQSEVVEFVFTLFSQAFEDGHFKKREIFFRTLNEVRRINLDRRVRARGLGENAT